MISKTSKAKDCHKSKHKITYIEIEKSSRSLENQSACFHKGETCGIRRRLMILLQRFDGIKWCQNRFAKCCRQRTGKRILGAVHPGILGSSSSGSSTPSSSNGKPLVQGLGGIQDIRAMVSFVTSRIIADLSWPTNLFSVQGNHGRCRDSNRPGAGQRYQGENTPTKHHSFSRRHHCGRC